MKKLIILILPIIICLSGCSLQADDASGIVSADNQESTTSAPVHAQYVKSVWFTYYELKNLIADDEHDFEKNIKNAFKKVKKMGFNTVTVQVRPCADAFYNSNVFPSSRYCFGNQGEPMPYDPLLVICSVANDLDLRLEAWVNPYRVSQDNKINELSNSNIAKKWYKSKSKKSYVYVFDNGIYFNPAVQDVTDLIVSGVKEIVENYDVDAVHFDDYFYPTTDKEIDALQYKAYKNKGGKSNLAEWRRNNISNMVKSVYSAIKDTDKSVLFGISPAANVKNDYSTLYADVEKWASTDGYVDYICPQVYYGFKNVAQPFMFTVKKWTYFTTCDLYIGLPLYKAGKADKYAGDEGEKEFCNNDNIIARQITYLSKLDTIKGFYIFSYSYLTDENAKAEVENMIDSMQNSSPH